MEENMKKLLIGAALLLLGACVTPEGAVQNKPSPKPKPTVVSASSSGKKVSKALTFRAAKNAVIATTDVGAPTDVRTNSTNATLIFDIDWTDQKADIPVTMTVELADTPETRIIKENGWPVFAEATFMYNYVKRSYTWDKQGTVTLPGKEPWSKYRFEDYPKQGYITIDNSGNCETYHLILDPSNGYRRQWKQSETFKIRHLSKTSNWELTSIADSYVSKSNPKQAPQFVSYKYHECYPDKATRAAYEAAGLR